MERRKRLERRQEIERALKLFRKQYGRGPSSPQELNEWMTEMRETLEAK